MCTDTVKILARYASTTFNSLLLSQVSVFYTALARWIGIGFFSSFASLTSDVVFAPLDGSFRIYKIYRHRDSLYSQTINTRQKLILLHTFDPMMSEGGRSSFRFGVCSDARCRCPLHAPLMDGELTDWEIDILFLILLKR